MPTSSVEERLAALEAEVAEIKKSIAANGTQAKPWWEQRFGAFACSPEYEEAAQAGRDYRESLRPGSDQDAS